MLHIDEKNYTVKISEPEVYVDNFKRNRSGHMTHAMTEFSPGKLIVFNSNCSAIRARGHSAYGWVEYRISNDYGKTYSETKVLPYSYEAFMNGEYTVSVEKAVTCNDGSILAFCLRNTMLGSVCCEPWLTPTAVRSCDCGETWEPAFEVSPYCGRIYAAANVCGKILFLQFKNDTFEGKSEENKYILFSSDDNGKTFTETELPIDGIGRGHGALLYDGNILHAYAYNTKNEEYIDHAVSNDLGRTWQSCEACYLDHKIRNPQTAFVDGVYILHGRGDNGLHQSGRGFVVYTSEDGYNWSNATIIAENGPSCYYSNNVLLDDGKDKRLLIQYSERSEPRVGVSCPYKQVDVLHRELRIKKK